MRSSFLTFMKNLNEQTPGSGDEDVDRCFCVHVHICVHISFAADFVEGGEGCKRVAFL